MELKIGKQQRKITETKIQCFERFNKLNKPLVMITKKKKKKKKERERERGREDTKLPVLCSLM